MAFKKGHKTWNKLTDEQIEIIKKYAFKIKMKDLAKKLGISRKTLTIYRNNLFTIKFSSLNPMKTIKIKNTTAAYIAGLLDGEGTIRISGKENGKYISYSPTIIISNCDKQVLLWIRSQLKIGIVRETRYFVNNKWRTPYVWSKYGLCILPILERIHPFLRIKKKHSKLLIKFCKLRLKQKRNEPYTREQIAIAHKIKKMNIRGGEYYGNKK